MVVSCLSNQALCCVSITFKLLYLLTFDLHSLEIRAGQCSHTQWAQMCMFGPAAVCSDYGLMELPQWGASHRGYFRVPGSFHGYVTVLSIYVHVLSESVSGFLQTLKVYTYHTNTEVTGSSLITVTFTTAERKDFHSDSAEKNQTQTTSNICSTCKGWETHFYCMKPNTVLEFWWELDSSVLLWNCNIIMYICTSPALSCFCFYYFSFAEKLQFFWD